MNIVEKTGSTVKEAIALALEELNITEEEANIEILEEEKKAILGLFGGKKAKVRVSIKETVESMIKEFLNNILDTMGLEAEINIKKNKNNINVNLVGENMAILIGRRGQTLDSIQYLLSLAVNRNKEDYLRITLDTENYRKKRKETLEKLAYRLSNKVRKMKKEVKLEPMNPYERRIIHSALQSNRYVSTRSEGDEPYRKVVIFLKNNDK